MTRFVGRRIQHYMRVVVRMIRGLSPALTYDSGSGGADGTLRTDHGLATEVGTEDHRHLDRAVGLLVILQDGDHRSRQGQTRAVQGVEETGTAAFGGAETEIG